MFKGGRVAAELTNGMEEGAGSLANHHRGSGHGYNKVYSPPFALDNDMAVLPAFES